MKNFLMSIIVPVYNTEKYLEQSIDSIIGQSIGFLENIVLILVNDGSVDSSADICKRYQSLYPDNIQYIEKENGGVSSARNTGIEQVKTKYFGFIDSDDYISRDAIHAVVEYFEKNTADSTVAIIKVENIGATQKKYAPSKKFGKETIIRDLKNPNDFDVWARAAPAFFRTEKTEKYRFDEDVRIIYEDIKYITDILVDHPLLGIVNKGVYYYRRYKPDDNVETSLTTGIMQDRRFYNESLRKVTLSILEKKNDNAPMSQYLEYVALYTLRWILLSDKANPAKILSPNEHEEYLLLLDKIFSLISDSSITSFDLISPADKIYFFGLKHNLYFVKKCMILFYWCKKKLKKILERR